MSDEKDPAHHSDQDTHHTGNDHDSNAHPDSPSHNQSEQGVTPSSNQNLILGIVMGAVVLLLLLLVINQQINKSGKPSKEDDLTAMKRELEEKKAANERMSYASGIDNGHSAELLANAIERDTRALAQLVADTAAEGAKLRASDSALLAAERQNRDLQNQLAQYRSAATRVTSLEAQVADLQNRLAGAVDKLTADAMRDELTRVKVERDRLLTELSQLRAETANMIDRDQYALLKADNDALKVENDQFRSELQRLRAEMNAASLFVTADRLSPKASKLFRELERLEGNSRTALKQAYLRIEKDFNARVVEEAHFATGSSELDREHELHIRDAAVAAPGNSFFLVVGYASKTGDAQQNEVLSSQRATRVASVTSYLKQQGQEVQAVYLGATDRFDAGDAKPNQVCEIWEIRP